MGSGNDALGEELRDDLILRRPVKAKFTPAQAVARIAKQGIERHHHVVAGHIGGNMVGVGDADIRGGIGGDIGDDVIVDLAVVGIQAHIHVNIGIERLEIINGLLIDLRLCLVGVILGPEDDLIVSGGIQGLRDLKGTDLARAVAGAEEKQGGQEEDKEAKTLSHPLVPPLETPSMIFLWKTRKRTIRGTEMTTTAAIMAGMFSRPKPFSRIS